MVGIRSVCEVLSLRGPYMARVFVCSCASKPVFSFSGCFAIYLSLLPCSLCMFLPFCFSDSLAVRRLLCVRTRSVTCLTLHHFRTLIQTILPRYLWRIMWHVFYSTFPRGLLCYRVFCSPINIYALDCACNCQVYSFGYL